MMINVVISSNKRSSLVLNWMDERINIRGCKQLLKDINGTEHIGLNCNIYGFNGGSQLCVIESDLPGSDQIIAEVIESGEYKEIYIPSILLRDSIYQDIKDVDIVVNILHVINFEKCVDILEAELSHISKIVRTYGKLINLPLLEANKRGIEYK